MIDRPKGYFPVPALKYIEGPTLDMVRDTLTSQTAPRGAGLFSQNLSAGPVRRSALGDHAPLRGSELWQVALLETWLQSHGV